MWFELELAIPGDFVWHKGMNDVSLSRRDDGLVAWKFFVNAREL